ncbi:MAG: endonuclease III [Methylovulum sp.]|jgi:endonuclease-3|nr:endonuclease III [Methylovulum sp.]
MNQKKRIEIFATLAEAHPNPTTELRYTSVFELLIAVVLSAQATDKSVNKATASLFALANTPQAMLQLSLETLKEQIKTIGLYNTKAKNIHLLCQQLLALHQGEVPNTRAALEALPGVGRKTANVLLNTAFGYPTIAVDTHIFRVANRTKLAVGKQVLAVEKLLDNTTPKQYKKDAHHLLILHGRYTCLARSPKCGQCIIKDLCEYTDKLLPS